MIMVIMNYQKISRSTKGFAELPGNCEQVENDIDQLDYIFKLKAKKRKEKKIKVVWKKGFKL